MQVLGIGALFWLVALGALTRILRLAASDGARRRWLLPLMLLLAAILMFRPHEDIFGGEDPGSYLNSGITYGNRGEFFHIDPVLSLIAPHLRPLFFFGHAGYGATKDACLWVRDTASALIGPRFQPAYPLLIALAVRLSGTPWAALYVVPIFAIFTALALRTLVLLLWPDRPWAGWTVFWLFLLNPLTVWHGRCPRPEVMAAYLLFAALAILMHAALSPSGRRRGDLLLAGVCALAAPFFHVTAWYAVLPLLLMLIMAGGFGRRDFLLALSPLPLMSGLHYYLAHQATDYYRLGYMSRQILAQPMWLAAAGLVVLLAWQAGRRLRHLTANRPAAPVAAGWVFAAATASFFVWCFFRGEADGSLPLLGRPVEHMFYLTDFGALRNMLSLSTVTLALAGWVLWCVLPGHGRYGRLALAATLFPAICLAGRINDFMMTRYFMVTVIPVLALALTALAVVLHGMFAKGLARMTAFKPAPAGSAGMALLLTCGLVLIGLRGRTHLVMLTEYRGLARYLQQFAAPVKEAQGALLVEYSRLAAPFDHFFDLPVLGVDNERRTDYGAIEAEWDRLMRQFPEIPVFFITPYKTAASDRFTFVPVTTASLYYRSLRQARRNLPLVIRDNRLTMRMYRIYPVGLAPQPGPESPGVYVREFDAGNMGLRNFANLRSGRWEISGMKLPPPQHAGAILTDVAADADAALMVFLNGEDGAQHHTAWMLNDAWRAGCHPPALDAVAWPDDAFAAGLAFFSGHELAWSSLSASGILTGRRRMPPLRARWSRAQSAILLPRPAEGAGVVMMLVRAPVVPGHPVISLALSIAGQPPFFEEALPPNEWRWLFAPFPETAPLEDWIWISMITDPAWNSGVRGFPDDLGVLVGMAAVIPFGAGLPPPGPVMRRDKPY